MALPKSTRVVFTKDGPGFAAKALGTIEKAVVGDEHQVRLDGSGDVVVAQRGVHFVPAGGSAGLSPGTRARFIQNGPGFATGDTGVVVNALDETQHEVRVDGAEGTVFAFLGKDFVRA